MITMLKRERRSIQEGVESRQIQVSRQLCKPKKRLSLPLPNQTSVANPKRSAQLSASPSSSTPLVHVLTMKPIVLEFSMVPLFLTKTLILLRSHYWRLWCSLSHSGTGVLSTTSPLPPTMLKPGGHRKTSQVCCPEFQPTPITSAALLIPHSTTSTV